MKEKINGNTLLKLGFKQGKWFAEALAYINSNDLSLDQMLSYLEQFRAAPMIPLDYEPKPLVINIKAENEEEQINVDRVIECMVELMKTPTVVKGSIMPDACPSGPV